MQLGNEQYYPAGAEQLPENKIFAQYYSPHTNAMKGQILKQLASPESKVRAIFATVAMEWELIFHHYKHQSGFENLVKQLNPKRRVVTEDMQCGIDV